MKPDLLPLLRCPACHASLDHVGSATSGARIDTGALICTECRSDYPIVGAVPRFVARDNYSATFGWQWNRFRRTQLDSHTGVSISRDRFFRQWGLTPSDFDGARVLDVGCGAGRFTEIALASGAEVVSMDYSTAVDACWANLSAHPRLNVVQADVYRLPFRPGTFDFVYCFGVLQHTPDVEGAFLALIEPLRQGGRLAVDLYPRLPLNVLWPKYWLRPVTRHIPPARLFPIVEWMVTLFFPLSLMLGRVPRIGRKLRYAIPIANYEGRLPLTRSQLQQWAVLDTFDMLSPRYDQPQTAATLAEWFKRANMDSVEVFRDGLVIGRGRRSLTAARDRRSPPADCRVAG